MNATEFVKDPRKIAIEPLENGRLAVYSPLLDTAKDALKSAGGKWDSQRGAWIFGATARAAAEKILRRWFGTAGEAVDRLDVEVTTPHNSLLGSLAYLLGSRELLSGKFGYPGASKEVKSDRTVWQIPALPASLLPRFEAGISAAAKQYVADREAAKAGLLVNQHGTISCKDCKRQKLGYGLDHGPRCDSSKLEPQMLEENVLFEAVLAADAGQPSVFQLRVVRTWTVAEQEAARAAERARRQEGHRAALKAAVKERAQGAAAAAQVGLFEAVIDRLAPEALTGDLTQQLAQVRAALSPEEVARLSGLEVLARQEAALRTQVARWLTVSVEALREEPAPRLLDPRRLSGTAREIALQQLAPPPVRAPAEEGSRFSLLEID